MSVLGNETTTQERMMNSNFYSRLGQRFTEAHQAVSANLEKQIIGMSVRVQTAPNGFVSGVVVSCTAKFIGGWVLGLECGEAKAYREVSVSGLPASKNFNGVLQGKA